MDRPDAHAEHPGQAQGEYSVNGVQRVLPASVYERQASHDEAEHEHEQNEFEHQFFVSEQQKKNGKRNDIHPKPRLFDEQETHHEQQKAEDK